MAKNMQTSHIWHPYSVDDERAPPLKIVRAKKSTLYDETGRGYLDATSSWWVNLHGHSHPTMARCLAKQAKKLAHVLFANCTHEPAETLAEKLSTLLPGPYRKIFFSDNGSTSIETALKIALKIGQAKGKTRVIALTGGYHGETFGAMSVSGENTFTAPYKNYLFPVDLIDPPKSQTSLNQIRPFLKDAACLVYEPVVQGAMAGMRSYSASGLNTLLQLCHEHDVLTIADEVFTGFGRLGPLFASNYLTEAPDIICLAKGLTGGFLPLGASACKEELFETLSSSPFYHGHSYAGNPLGCSAALASLELLTSAKSTLARARIAQSHKIMRATLLKHPKIVRLEAIGTLLVVECASTYDYTSSLMQNALAFFLKRGILLRPLGNVLYILPPYCITIQELETIYSALRDFLEQL